MPSKNRKNKSKYKKHIHTTNNTFENNIDNEIKLNLGVNLDLGLNLFNLYTNLFWSISDSYNNNDIDININEHNDLFDTTG